MTSMPLSDEQITVTLVKVFRDTLGVSFTTSIQMDEVDEWDSLAHTQLLVAIENAFGFELQFEDAIKMISGTAIIEVVRKTTNTAAE